MSKVANVKAIPLYGKYSKGHRALVDEDVYLAVSAFRWRRDKKGYARSDKQIAGGKSVTLLMHRVITNAPTGLEVDHINGDRLDNRRSNLRVCTRHQNAGNITVTRNRQSRFRGVTPVHGGWAARIKHFYKIHQLGVFPSEEEAALAFNEAAKRLRGEFASLNEVVPS